MDGVPQPGPWWHAVGAPLERLVRPHRVCTARHDVLPLLAPPLGLPAPRCRRWCGRISSRRASAVAEEAIAGPGGPMNWLTIIAAYAVRCSDLVRWLQVIVFVRRGTVCQPRLALPYVHAVRVPHGYPARTGRAVRSCSARRPFPVAQFTPTGSDFAGALYGTGCFVRPNVRVKPAPTAWRDGQQAQNGPQALRLMAGAPRCWGSA